MMLGVAVEVIDSTEDESISGVCMTPWGCSPVIAVVVIVDTASS